MITLSTLVLFADQYDETVDFYRNGLKLAVQETSPGFTQFNLGTTTFAIHPLTPGMAEMATNGRLALHFNVENIEAVLDHLYGQHYLTTRPPVRTEPWGKEASITDPSGYHLELVESAT